MVRAWWVQAAWRQDINLDTISRFLVFSSKNEQELWLLYRNSGRGLFCWCWRLLSLYDDLLHISESDTQFVTVLNPQGQCFNEVFIVAVWVGNVGAECCVLSPMEHCPVR